MVQFVHYLYELQYYNLQLKYIIKHSFKFGVYLKDYSPGCSVPNNSADNFRSCFVSSNHRFAKKI